MRESRKYNAKKTDEKMQINWDEKSPNILYVCNANNNSPKLLAIVLKKNSVKK